MAIWSIIDDVRIILVDCCTKWVRRPKYTDIPNSQLGEFDFSMLAKIVPVIVFFATVVWSVGRERGHSSMSNIGGLLVVLAVYHILEPFGFALLTDQVDIQTAIFGSLRLLPWQ